MYVSPAKHGYAWLPRKCDYRTDRQTHRRTSLWILLLQYSTQFCKEFDESSCIDDMWSNFSQWCSDTLSTCVPSRQSSQRITQPWANREVRRLSRSKRKWHKIARQTGSTSAWDHYTHLKHTAQQKCREAYNSHINNMLSDDTGGKKKFWTYIKSRKTDRCGVAPLKKDGITYSDSITKADLLNKQFASVFSHEAPGDLPDLGHSDTPDVPRITVSVGGVVKLLKDINPSKATGPDSIPGKLLKEAASELAPALTLIFQTSINQGRIPNDWKSAKIAPVYKKGDRSQPSNYRPISLTSICCKLIEHIIHSSVITHLENHSILTDFQHGFRKRRSTETQLILTVQDLVSNLNAGEQTDVILLDFSKAFDKVPHNRLLLKLQHYGVRGNILAWIRDFLSDRTQEVVLDGTTSTRCSVTSGVPQGTVLGPLLFLVYINDMPSCVQSPARLFADDCLVYKKIRSQDDCIALQEDLQKLQEWEERWLMQFHPEKCEVITISNRRSPTKYGYSIHGHQLQHVDNAKYLGVTINKSLSWNPHVDNVTKKANQTLAFLRRNIGMCSQDSKEQAYKTFVRPTLEYASTVWDPHTARNINAVEMVQRRAARFTTGNYHRTSSVSTILSALKWDSLQLRRARARTIMLFRIHNRLVDISPEEYLVPTGIQTRGHTIKFLQPQARIQAYQYSFFPCAIRYWNSLPAPVVQISSVEAFKQSLATINII